jgi:glycosyltransferase involved in cell wall biosynthesis
MNTNFIYAGWYDLRLKVSQSHSFFHIPEFLYTEKEIDTRKSGEQQFDYVNPKNREVQIEMEQACTLHLKDCGAYLAPEFKKMHLEEEDFPVEATVVIPVKNRVKTIADAIYSVINQKADFAFNLIIVDNHSTDGTTELIQDFSKNDTRIIHVVPHRDDLGIGGCWNEAIFHPKCGKFVIQLDSDDLYSHDQVLSQIVRSFYEQQCAMMIGTYRMVNFKLEEIPPGIIDHREWTPENGRNNALRINGLGAPRAFYTPVLRTIRFPNVSYGEDYMLGLMISRHYQIGRIYESLYLCRRWEENSDAELDVHKLNTYNFYKDKIRTVELQARKTFVSEKNRGL